LVTATNLLLTGRTRELASPGGWLLAAAIGVLIMFPAGLVWTFAEPQKFLSFLQEGKIDAADLVRIGIGIYLIWLFGIAFYYLKQINQKIGKFWLSINRSFTEGQKLSVKYDLVRKLMETFYAADVVPYLKLWSGDRVISGYCLKYAWKEPSYLLVAEDKEKGQQVLKVFVGTVDAVEVVKERCIFKRPGAVDEFFRLVHSDLPELMRERQDGR
jgi:hypothetical protein